MKFFASCGKGLEYLLADELVELGCARATATIAGANVEGELGDAQRAVLWSRLASRILWPIAEFDCADEHALYAGAAEIDWTRHVGAGHSIAVDAHVSGSAITHARYAAQRVKDAVVDVLREATGARPDVDVEAPDVRLNLVVRKGRATLSIDLGGGPLHRRGWRGAQGEAPLKENLATAVLLRGGWPQANSEGGDLLDPMCGSGTLLIEGALMAADVAPNLQRFGRTLPTRWPGFDVEAWNALLAEARERAQRGLAALRPCIHGSDIDPHAIRIARENARAAGVETAIDFAVRDIADLPAMANPRGVVACNPPYDARLAADPALYEGKQDLARVEQLTRSAGLTALQATALREFDQALASAGDLRGALDLFKRERDLSTRVMQDNRAAALALLQQRNDRERKQRDIELLARDNELKTAALANRDTMLQVWAVAAVVLGLSAAAVGLLYRRVRETNRRLVASQAQLRVQSERDPLTNLANRRHFLSVMQAEQARGGADAGFDGALLLVDIDHFKHVNDGHGHAAGDIVLCEVARRLNQAVRGDDLVVRWGGEEFLVLALKVPAAQAEQMAARILAVIGEQPVMVQGVAVRVTVSIGYARFPLPPDVLPIAWEQAINLADMALYTAKNQGRNRAVGIVAAQAPAAPELRAIEDDFDRAWHEGKIMLQVAPGPAVAAAA